MPKQRRCAEERVSTKCSRVGEVAMRDKEWRVVLVNNRDNAIVDLLNGSATQGKVDNDATTKVSEGRIQRGRFFLLRDSVNGM